MTIRRLGYVGASLSLGVTTSHTCRLQNATPQRLRELVSLNLAGLKEILAFNLQHGILLYRISSQIIPFASHPANMVPWWEEFAEDLAAIGAFIIEHQMRVSMHPGRFTLFNTPKPAVLSASHKELGWHVRFLDSLGVDSKNKIVLHVGGEYGEKPEAIARFEKEIVAMPGFWRDRLVVENDERSYTADDVLAMSKITGLPVLVDWLHYRVNPGGRQNAQALLTRCFETWREEDGLPKVHFSSQAAKARPGSHAEWANVDEFVEFLATAPALPFDCMLEAKKKDLALLKLQAELAERGIFLPRAA